MQFGLLMKVLWLCACVLWVCVFHRHRESDVARRRPNTGQVTTKDFDPSPVRFSKGGMAFGRDLLSPRGGVDVGSSARGKLRLGRTFDRQITSGNVSRISFDSKFAQKDKGESKSGQTAVKDESSDRQASGNRPEGGRQHTQRANENFEAVGSPGTWGWGEATPTDGIDQYSWEVREEPSLHFSDFDSASRVPSSVLG
jgi:hypothetical protein